MDGRTNKSPPVFYRTSSPSGPLPKRVYFRHKRADFKSERADFRPERAWGDEVTNRSPKVNMWSAIPVALLCMILNWSKKKQGSGPEGDEVL